MSYLLEGQESERLLFRRLREEDFHAWLPFFEDPLSNKYWKSEITDPVLQCKTWFQKTFQRYASNTGGMNVITEKSSGAFVGQCGLLIQHVDAVEELELGYSIMPAFRNRGFATEASTKAIEHAFKNKLSNSLISIIHEDNIESEKVAIKNKMQLDKRTMYSSNPVKIYRIFNID